MNQVEWRYHVQSSSANREQAENVIDILHLKNDLSLQVLSQRNASLELT